MTAWKFRLSASSAASPAAMAALSSAARNAACRECSSRQEQVVSAVAFGSAVSPANSAAPGPAAMSQTRETRRVLVSLSASSDSRQDRAGILGVDG